MSAEIKYEIRACTFCGKILKDELSMILNDKEICYTCSVKIASALDAAEEILLSGYDEDIEQVNETKPSLKKKQKYLKKKNITLLKLFKKLRNQ